MAEACSDIVIKVVRNEDLVEQIGKHIYFDLVDLDKVHTFRVRRQMHFKVFKQEVAKEFRIPVEYQRFWLWLKLQNGTSRPKILLTPSQEELCVGQVPTASASSELKLFLEVELGQHLQPIPLPEKTDEDILIFFKLYDPFKLELRYVGRMLVKSSGKPIEILSRINKMAGFGPDEEIQLYEEVRFVPNVICPRIDKKRTFLASLLNRGGSIICFQKSYEVGSEQYLYPDVPSFLDYVHSRKTIQTMTSLPKDKQNNQEDMEEFFESLECELASAKTVSLQQVKEALRMVEEALNIAPANLDDSRRISSIRKLKAAVKVLYFSDCSSATLTLNQKEVLLILEKDYEELSGRAAKAIREKNLIHEKESIKLTLCRSLDSNHIKFKEAKAESEEIEKRIATLQAQINEEESKKEKIQGVKKEMFEVCKDSKLKLSELQKQWPEYEARVKTAKEEEKIVEAKLRRMKLYVSSLKKALN